MLRGKQILFIGDSVGHHWLNALLLDAHNKLPSLFPSNTSSWREFYSEPSPWQYDNRGFCAPPFHVLNMSSALESAPVITTFVFPNNECPPTYKKERYKACCPRGIPIGGRMAAISAKLLDTKPDIVIAQMGIHWHTVPSFRSDVSDMVKALGQYATLNSGSLILFLESLPQHFDAPDGSYDGWRANVNVNRSAFLCPPLNLTRVQTDQLVGDDMSVGIYNLNQIARREVEVTEGVHWLPANSGAAFAVRHDAHKGATKCCSKHTDCSHYCYSPDLWRPALDPFYSQVYASMHTRADARPDQPARKGAAPHSPLSTQRGSVPPRGSGG